MFILKILVAVWLLKFLLLEWIIISIGVHGFKKKENKQISSQTVRAWS